MAKSRRGLTEDLELHVLDKIGLEEVYLAFQPVVDLRDGETFAYEALLRSNDPRFRSPPQVIAEAIERGCCGELGRYLRTLAVERCGRHTLFLNIHPNEFDDGWLVRPDDPIFLHEHPVYLEITESVPMTHSGHCTGTLREIRGKGIRLAVDDLGAGYSNLRYIADLEPEIVKLDRDLISNLAGNARLFRLVRSVVSLCRELDAEVVAEGIETAAELACVQEAGVYFGQGYYLARPAFPPPEPVILKSP